MFDNRVLGVDPGLSRCGVAVIDGPSGRPQQVATEVVRTGAEEILASRLVAIHDGIRAMIQTHRPAALAVERVFINAQARTGVGAIQVVGLVHLLGAQHGLPVAEYTPSQVKAAVTGVGNADKDQVTFMVMRLLCLAEAPKPADRADALAVALCHLQQPSYSHAGAGAGAGLPPRLAAALEQAGPGLQAIQPRRDITSGGQR